MIRSLWLVLLPLCAWANPGIPSGPDHCLLPRNTHGKIARSHVELRAFVRTHACPATGKHSIHCPGYVIDHARPLCACGKDSPENMQWQTVADSKRKDRLEDALCEALKRRGYVK